MAREGYHLPHFSEQLVKLAAKGKVVDAKLQLHLDECQKCTQRVSKHRLCSVIATQGLSTLNPIDVVAVKNTSRL